MKKFLLRPIFTIITMVVFMVIPLLTLIPQSILAGTSAGNFNFDNNDGLRIDGSTTAFPLVAAAAGIIGAGGKSSGGPFQSLFPMEIEVYQLSSSVGMVDCQNQVVDLGMTASVGNIANYPNLVATKIARDAIYPIINCNGNSIKDITPNQLKAIYNAYYAVGWNGQGSPTNIQINDGTHGTPGITTDWLGKILSQPLTPITTWNQLNPSLPNQPINIASIYKAVGILEDSLHLDSVDSEPATEYKSATPALTGDADIVNYVVNLQWTIGMVHYNSQPSINLPNVQALSVDGVSPTPENITIADLSINSGGYPLSYYLYLTQYNNPTDPSVVANRSNANNFINFLLSDAGQNIVEQEGFVRLIPREDINRDGVINVMDEALIRQKWGQNDLNGWIPEDINQDGYINMRDMVKCGLYGGITYGSSSDLTADYPDQGCNPTITLISSANPETFGQPVDITALVAPIPNGGSIQFQDNGMNVGSEMPIDNLGRAIFPASALSTGSHAITAVYIAENGFNPAPAILNQIVNQTSGNSITISSSAQSANWGDNFDVNVLLNNNVPVYSWQADITFDATKIICDSVTQGTFPESFTQLPFFMYYPIDNNNGQIHLFGTVTGQNSAPSGTNGLLATIHFTAKTGTIGTAGICLSNVILIDSGLNVIPGVTTTSGNVTINNQPPTITSFNPSTGEPGTTIMINGSNFTPGATVSFGGTAATNVTYISSSQLTAVVENGTSGPLTITTSCGTASSTPLLFTFNNQSNAPIITSFAPTTATRENLVIINGRNLRATSSVSFGGTPAQTFFISSDTQVIATLANGSSGAISVVTFNGTATIDGFTYIPGNTNTQVSVSPANQSVVDGTNLSVNLAINTSTPIRGWQADITFDPSKLQYTGATEGAFLKDFAGNTVFSPWMIDNTNGKISSIGSSSLGGPSGGPSGTGILATLNFTVKTGVSGNALISVTNLEVDDVNAFPLPDVAVNSGVISINSGAQTVTSLNSSPSQSTVGQLVTFTASVSPKPDGGTIQFYDNGNKMDDNPVQLNDAGQAIYTTSSLAAGNHTITAVYSGDLNYEISTGTLNQTVIPLAPVITSFTPISGTAGSPVVINGTHFNGTTLVKFGGIPARTFIVNSDTQITAILGNGASGAVGIITAGGAAAKDGFTYIPLTTNPQVSVSPANQSVGDGMNFSINLAVNTSTPIRGWQVDITFDPAKLQCTDTAEGAFLKDFAGNTYFFPGTIDNINGKISGIGSSSLGGPSGGPSGTGILVTLSFTAKTGVNGNTAISLVNPELLNVNAFPIPNMVSNNGNVSIYSSNIVTAVNLAGNADNNGTITQAVTAPSTDNQAAVTIDAGTKAVTADGVPVSQITVNPVAFPPPPPANSIPIGLTYGFGPSGAVFYQPVSITLRYDPSALPAGYDESKLYVAWYDPTNNQWVKLSSTVDTVNKLITAETNHFSGYAIMYNTVITAPVITGVSPSIASTKDWVTITGTNLSGTTQVLFGGIPAQDFFINPGGTQIIAIVGAGTSGDVSIISVDGNAVLSGFYFVPWWDINRDRITNILDVVRIGLHWNTHTGDSNYDPNCDVNSDGVINISDVVSVGLHWNQSW
jgi:ABC-type phosphate transport system substrate-binding protein